MRLFAQNRTSDARTLVRRHGAVALLLAGIFFMCALAFEQDRTIVNQRELIQSLFRDSLELNAMRMQRAQTAKHR
jgi:hypothetical protein